jgi:hypothetical protein
MKDSSYFNIGYRYGADNKIEHMRTASPLIPDNYTYVYHSSVLPKNTTKWYIECTSPLSIGWKTNIEYRPIPEHEVPSDIKAMNLLLIGD